MPEWSGPCVDDKVVELAPGQNVVDVLEEYLADRRIDRVEQDGLVVEQQIGIVGNSVRNGVNALEHGKSAVIPADPPEILQNLADTVHKFLLRMIYSFFCYGKCVKWKMNNGKWIVSRGCQLCVVGERHGSK